MRHARLALQVYLQNRASDRVRMFRKDENSFLWPRSQGLQSILAYNETSLRWRKRVSLNDNLGIQESRCTFLSTDEMLRATQSSTT